MHDELTAVDIKKMEEEIRYRTTVLGPELLAEMKRTREFGDLSENAEYKEAKREKRRNESRIRYLENMIRTAHIVQVREQGDRVGLFSWVTVRNEKMGGEKRFQIVTTLRADAARGFISKESPLGAALMGKRVGDRAHVQVNPSVGYDVTVLSIEPGEDNEELNISAY